MKIIKNESLGKYTTIKIGGLAKKFYIPENEIELVKLCESLIGFKLIGGGSNLLINDKKEFENIIYLKEFNKKLILKEDGTVVSGASISLQKLINFINENGYGGIEYLYSVPGLVGGAVYMNAGRGKKYNKCISDYIISVKVLHENKIKYLTKDECLFDYRNSIFHDDTYVILEIKFKFERKNISNLRQDRLDRMKLVKNTQDSQYPNFGTVFSTCNTKLLKLTRLSFLNKQDGVQFSKKTLNWLINKNDGTYLQAIKRIKRTEKIHKIFNVDFRIEVKIWD